LESKRLNFFDLNYEIFEKETLTLHPSMRTSFMQKTTQHAPARLNVLDSEEPVGHVYRSLKNCPNAGTLFNV
jgi:hypothetical protein